MHTTEWELLWRLGLALMLSTVIGLEREYRQKSAGLRTYTLVGLGSALFLLVSDFGSIGGGLISSRQDAVMTYPLIAGPVLGNAGFAVSDLNFQRHDEDAVVVVHAAQTDPV
jgi:putative Mg2+ transporter-C (MgtC) family protein